MKQICNIILFTFLASLAQAQEETNQPQVSELTKAYQREILFLSTYKKELQNKVETIKHSLGRKVSDGEKQLKEMESHWLAMQTDNEVTLQKLSAIERDYENKQENKDLLQTTLKQAQLSLKNTTEDAIAKDKNLLTQIQGVFLRAQEDLKTSVQITDSKGRFYSKKGEEQEGEIITLGSIARFANVDGKIAALYPSGGGTFRVWKWLDSSARVLSQGKLPSSLKLFLFENSEKEFQMAHEKTVMDVLRSGGLIGWLIIALGLIALIISILRFLLLKRAQNGTEGLLQKVIMEIKMGDLDQAQHMLLAQNNAITRVLAKTLSYLKSEPQKVEDAIQEAILKESQMIDRFGVVILVIASVAPLMGLLGTVSGMISTFDIITLYGTGNPKLLSGGISEALVTTMFGLIVAIPALLVGQFLSAKTEHIKSDMEKWALATCNAFNNKKSC